MDLNRENAWALLTEYTKGESLQKHALGVEAAVRGYARTFGEDEEGWGITALLHDFDYEMHPTLDKHPQDGAGVITSLTETDGLVELLEDATKIEPGASVGFLSYATLIN